MPLFTVTDGALRSIPQVRPGPELYEFEIQELIWGNVEAFYGADLLPICKDQRISTGGRPDVVCLDESGRVVIFEVKRSIERAQLAQCLEYAGWARRANLDELSALHHAGPDAFFEAWLEFTGSSTPVVVNPSPILVLVAQDFDDRTSGALAFLTENSVPVFTVPVKVFAAADHERIYLIDSDFDDSVAVAEEHVGRARPTAYRFRGERVSVAHLVEAGFLDVGEAIEYQRAREGKVFTATITTDGQIQVEDGRVFSSLSRAATTLAGLIALPGWQVWTAPQRGGKRLEDLRRDFLDQAAASES